MKTLVTIDHSKISLLTYWPGVGDAPTFRGPKEKTADILNRLKEIEKVFTEEGDYDLSYPKLEEYALCLLEDENIEESLKLFRLIAGDTNDLLFQKEDNSFVMVANKFGKLGCEGLHSFAFLLNNAGDTQRAGILFKDLIDKGPFCLGIRGCDIHVDAFEEVLKLKLPFMKEDSYKRKYEKAKDDQF